MNGTGDNDGNVENESLSSSSSSLHRQRNSSGFENANIPREWHAAGFMLSPCGTGLVLPSPSVSDMTRLLKIKSKRDTMSGTGRSYSKCPLPPQHCTLHMIPFAVIILDEQVCLSLLIFETFSLTKYIFIFLDHVCIHLNVNSI